MMGSILLILSFACGIAAIGSLVALCTQDFPYTIQVQITKRGTRWDCVIATAAAVALFIAAVRW